MFSAHVLDQIRIKLNDKSKKYVFIGYDEKTKDLKLFDPIAKKVIVSQDVQVSKESAWDWKNQMEEKQEESLSVAPINTPIISPNPDE